MVSAVLIPRNLATVARGLLGFDVVMGGGCLWGTDVVLATVLTVGLVSVVDTNDVSFESDDWSL
jgi:hypothetical protein